MTAIPKLPPAARPPIIGETGSWSAESDHWFQSDRAGACVRQPGHLDVHESRCRRLLRRVCHLEPAGEMRPAADVVNNNASTAFRPKLRRPVDQTPAPADYEAAGVFWHHLGVFEVTTSGHTDGPTWPTRPRPSWPMPSSWSRQTDSPDHGPGDGRLFDQPAGADFRRVHRHRLRRPRPSASASTARPTAARRPSFCRPSRWTIPRN